MDIQKYVLHANLFIDYVFGHFLTFQSKYHQRPYNCDVPLNFYFWHLNTPLLQQQLNSKKMLYPVWTLASDRVSSCYGHNTLCSRGCSANNVVIISDMISIHRHIMRMIPPILAHWDFKILKCYSSYTKSPRSTKIKQVNQSAPKWTRQQQQQQNQQQQKNNKNNYNNNNNNSTLRN